MNVKAAPSLEEVRGKRDAILRTLAARGGRNPRVFGSVACGDAVADSDVDLVVEFDGPVPTGFRYFGMIRALQEDLSAIVGRPVHVVRGSSSSGSHRVAREAVPL